MHCESTSLCFTVFWKGQFQFFEGFWWLLFRTGWTIMHLVKLPQWFAGPDMHSRNGVWSKRSRRLPSFWRPHSNLTEGCSKLEGPSRLLEQINGIVCSKCPQCCGAWCCLVGPLTPCCGVCFRFVGPPTPTCDNICLAQVSCKCHVLTFCVVHIRLCSQILESNASP